MAPHQLIYLTSGKFFDIQLEVSAAVRQQQSRNTNQPFFKISFGFIPHELSSFSTSPSNP